MTNGGHFAQIRGALWCKWGHFAQIWSLRAFGPKSEHLAPAGGGMAPLAPPPTGSAPNGRMDRQTKSDAYEPTMQLIIGHGDNI